MIEPIATTVATLDPHTNANIAQARIPASASPPCQWPMMEVAKSIIRRATPPWVRNVPARMKNGIAMISKRSMPVNSFNATAAIGTSVIVNMKINTVRPRPIEDWHAGQHERGEQCEDQCRARARRDVDEAVLRCDADRDDQNGDADQDIGGIARALRARWILAESRLPGNCVGHGDRPNRATAAGTADGTEAGTGFTVPRPSICVGSLCGSSPVARERPTRPGENGNTLASCHRGWPSRRSTEAIPYPAKPDQSAPSPRRSPRRMRQSCR